MEQDARQPNSGFNHILFNGRLPARFLLLAGIVGGILTIVFYLFIRPDATNTFDVFYAAARTGFEGDIVYDTEHGLYVYTPVVLYYFYPYTLVDFPTALLIHRILSLAVAFGYGMILTWFLDMNINLSKIDKVLIVTFAGVSIHPIVITVLGGVEIILGFLLGVGFIALELGRDRESGGFWAVASLVKVFPAAWGAYLLRVRRWRAILAAIVTGLGATAIGVVTFGTDAYIRYFRTASGDRVRINSFSGGASPDTEAVTPLRPLAQIFPNVDPHIWPPIILAAVGAMLVFIYFLTPDTGLDDRVILLFATVIGITFIMPTSQDMDMYLMYGPLVLLVYLERFKITRVLFAFGGLIMTYNFGREEVRSVSSLLGENIQSSVMSIAEPVLAFASMPLYGLGIMFVACLMHAWYRGKESGRVNRFRTRLSETIFTNI